MPRWKRTLTLACPLLLCAVAWLLIHARNAASEWDRASSPTHPLVDEPSQRSAAESGESVRAAEESPTAELHVRSDTNSRDLQSLLDSLRQQGISEITVSFTDSPGNVVHVHAPAAWSWTRDRVAALQAAVVPSANLVVSGGVRGDTPDGSAERQALKLAARLRQLRETNGDPREHEQLHTRLRQLLRNAFAFRQQQYRNELELNARRLDRLRTAIEQREAAADQIIERRFQELLSPELSWDTSEVDQDPKQDRPDQSARAVGTPDPLGSDGLYQNATDPMQPRVDHTVEQTPVQPNTLILTVPVPRSVHSLDVLRKNVGVKNITLLATRVAEGTGTANDHDTAVIARHCELAGIPESTPQNPDAWSVQLVVPQGMASDGSYQAITQAMIDSLAVSATTFRLDHLREFDAENEPAASATADEIAQLRPVSRVDIRLADVGLGPIEWISGPSGSGAIVGARETRLTTDAGSTLCFRLSQLPGHEDTGIFVTVKVHAPDEVTHRIQAGIMKSNPIPMQLTESELIQAAGGDEVHKVVYIPDDLSTAGPSMMKSISDSRTESSPPLAIELPEPGTVVCELVLSTKSPAP